MVDPEYRRIAKQAWADDMDYFDKTTQKLREALVWYVGVLVK